MSHSAAPGHQQAWFRSLVGYGISLTDHVNTSREGPRFEPGRNHFFCFFCHPLLLNFFPSFHKNYASALWAPRDVNRPTEIFVGELVYLYARLRALLLSSDDFEGFPPMKMAASAAFFFFSSPTLDWLLGNRSGPSANFLIGDSGRIFLIYTITEGC